MGRPHRLQVENGVYHITANAVQDRMLFPTALEREMFLDVLMIAIARAEWLCHAYCALGTHYHLIVQTPVRNLDTGMKRLNWLYAWRHNRRFGTRGHAFKSRYSSRLIETHEHAVAAVRYVALNPVEAGVCRHPQDWPWSSYSATIGLDDPLPFLSIDWALGLFDDRRHVARRLLRHLVEGRPVDAAA